MDDIKIQVIAFASIYIIFSSLLVYGALYIYSRYLVEHSIEINKSVAQTMLFSSIVLFLVFGSIFITQPDDIYNVVIFMVTYTLLVISASFTRLPFEENTIVLPYFIAVLAIIAVVVGVLYLI
jgi:hypothetical protein